MSWSIITPNTFFLGTSFRIVPFITILRTLVFMQALWADPDDIRLIFCYWHSPFTTPVPHLPKFCIHCSLIYIQVENSISISIFYNLFLHLLPFSKALPSKWFKIHYCNNSILFPISCFMQWIYHVLTTDCTQDFCLRYAYWVLANLTSTPAVPL